MTVRLDEISRALREAGQLVETRGALPEIVTDITDDSRRVSTGALFLAVRGTSVDGHAYLARAAELGASAAVIEDAAASGLPALVVSDSRRAAAVAAASFHRFPARALRLIGVTGTNGKSTTVGILRHLIHGDEARAASIGTLGVLLDADGSECPGGEGLTTPGPVELQRLLRTLVDRGVRVIAMEVSSHSLHQRRVEGLTFEVAVFTNLTRDHLDYHTTMEAYFAAKAELVGHLSPQGVAVINAEDASWRALPRAARVIRFSAGATVADVYARKIRATASGSEFTLHLGGAPYAISLPLLGDFNVANAVAAAAAAWVYGIDPARIAERLSQVPQVPGRLEVIATDPAVLRDYAHTPDSLERALRAVRPFTQQRLIVVFGAGGDRDAGKRPLMGAAAERYADLAIVTSDNPRTEDPERILDDIERGMPRRAHERISDRREAIARALHEARTGDVVLLAGKGHETYQIRGTEKLPFDERVIVQELLAESAR